jgi:putative glutathione S-transferase
MGRLVDGVWQAGWAKPREAGAFERPPTKFRARITADGSSGFAAEAGRYRLYVSYACPWAHRTLIARALLGLEDAIAVTVVDPKMGDDGWLLPDGAGYLREVYLRADARYTGQVTVPVLWDEKSGTIVNNESREIMRMFDTELGGLAKAGAPAGGTLAPAELRPRIDEVLDAIYAPINNGVYRAGFATTQAAYEAACRELFAALDHWDDVLGRQRFTCGSTLTEADVALFTTSLRFDLVYYAHFKCNVRRLRDYENLWGFTRDVYQRPAVKATCRLDHIKVHYYWSQENVNPHRIVPLGPTLELDAAHDRARLG